MLSCVIRIQFYIDLPQSTIETSVHRMCDRYAAVRCLVCVVVSMAWFFNCDERRWGYGVSNNVSLRAWSMTLLWANPFNRSKKPLRKSKTIQSIMWSSFVVRHINQMKLANVHHVNVCSHMCLYILCILCCLSLRHCRSIRHRDRARQKPVDCCCCLSLLFSWLSVFLPGR